MLRSIVMSTFLYTLLGLSVGGSLHCAQRQQISPCTCTYDLHTGQQLVQVACEKMTSFAEVEHALKGQFGPDTRLKLRITHSTLDDLSTPEGPGFADLGLRVLYLNISDNNLRYLRPDVFETMGNVTSLNLADNQLFEVPVQALEYMPKLRTLALGGNQLKALRDNDLKSLGNLETLIVTDNEISEVGAKSFPPKLRRLGIGRNKITALDGSLRNLGELEWLYIEQNMLTSLDQELPLNSKLTLINITHNQLTSMPEDLHLQTFLDKLLLNHNEISLLGGALKKSKRLQYAGISYNQITSLNEDEFLECERLQELALSHNKITELNGALRPLRAVQRLSLHHNMLTEFDLSQVRGLKKLQELDLRHNVIDRLISQVEMQNVVESLDNPVLTELRLGHNKLATLDGFLLGLRSLNTLDLSHNEMRYLPPDELVGLDNLRFLDISHNQISTLADTSKKLLPSLETLLAGNNLLTQLNEDLHGFPKICVADLSNNNIDHISTAIATKSSCVVKDVISTLRIYLQGNPLKCTRELAIAQEMTEVYRAEMVGVPDCEKFEPAVVPSPVSLPFLHPTVTIPEILEVKKMESQDNSQMQTGMEEMNEAAYHAEPLVMQEEEKDPNNASEPILEMGPLIQALVSSSTPSAE